MALTGEPEKRASRWEGPTLWGKAKAILSGKSRGANLVILALFLVFASGVSDAVTSRLGFPSEAGATLRVFAALSFGAGIVSYVRGD